MALGRCDRDDPARQILFGDDEREQRNAGAVVRARHGGSELGEIFGGGRLADETLRGSADIGGDTRTDEANFADHDIRPRAEFDFAER